MAASFAPVASTSQVPESLDDEEMSSQEEEIAMGEKRRRKASKRNRTITKCDRCRQRKQRCNSIKPCDTCRAYQVPCQYSIGQPLEVHEELITAAPRDVESIRDGLARLERILQAHAQNSGRDPSTINLTSIGVSEIPRPNSLPVDLEKDNIAAHIAQLWLKSDVSEQMVSNCHPLVGELHKLVKSSAPPLRIANSAHSTPSSRGSSSTNNSSKSPFPTNTRNLSDAKLLEYLPNQSQTMYLLEVFFGKGNWFFELCDRDVTRHEVTTLYVFLHSISATRSSTISGVLTQMDFDRWISVATIFALCRVALNFVSTEDAAKWHIDLKCGRSTVIEGWGDMASVALDKAQFVARPTLPGFKAMTLLLSAVYFENDGLGSSEVHLRWRALAVQIAFAMRLHREPSAKMDRIEADQRRRLFWSLVCIDAHLAVAASSPQNMIQLEMTDVRIPRSPPWSQCAAAEATLDDETSLLDLRSSEVRFLTGAFNNRVSRLTARREPLPTAEDVIQLDDELVKWGDRVTPEHKLQTHQDNIYVTSLDPSADVFLGQQVFYVSFFYLRLRLNRPLHTPGPANLKASNTGKHRDAVLKSSLLLLRLHEMGRLSTAFISAVANAALSIILDVYVRPDSGDGEYLLEKLRPFLSDLETFNSPLLQRASIILQSLLADARRAKSRADTVEQPSFPMVQVQSSEWPWSEAFAFGSVQPLAFPPPATNGNLSQGKSGSVTPNFSPSPQFPPTSQVPVMASSAPRQQPSFPQMPSAPTFATPVAGLHGNPYPQFGASQINPMSAFSMDLDSFALAAAYAEFNPLLPQLQQWNGPHSG